MDIGYGTSDVGYNFGELEAEGGILSNLAPHKAGHDNIVATLVGAGADVNKAGCWDIPLTAAAEAGHDNIVATLIGKK